MVALFFLYFYHLIYHQEKEDLLREEKSYDTMLIASSGSWVHAGHMIPYIFWLCCCIEPCCYRTLITGEIVGARNSRYATHFFRRRIGVIGSGKVVVDKTLSYGAAVAELLLISWAIQNNQEAADNTEVSFQIVHITRHSE